MENETLALSPTLTFTGTPEFVRSVREATRKKSRSERSDEDRMIAWTLAGRRHFEEFGGRNRYGCVTEPKKNP